MVNLKLLKTNLFTEKNEPINIRTFNLFIYLFIAKSKIHDQIHKAAAAAATTTVLLSNK